MGYLPISVLPHAENLKIRPIKPPRGLSWVPNADQRVAFAPGYLPISVLPHAENLKIKHIKPHQGVEVGYQMQIKESHP